MTRLRQAMNEAMRQRGYSVRTHQAYLAAVTDLQHYLGHTSIQTTMGYLHWIANYRFTGVVH